ncbi:MAG: winged helix-turn-helix transcriptional regulator [Promethearchaeota archaeon]
MGQKNECIDPENSETTEERLSWHCVRHKENYNCTNECVLQSVLQLFGNRYTLSIIRTLLRSGAPLRFNQLLKEVGGSPKTITRRLRDLEKHKILIREVFHNEIPVKVEYSLTKSGKDLEDIFERMSIWARNWIKNIS